MVSCDRIYLVVTLSDLQKPTILDPTSNGDKVLDQLGELIIKLNELQEKAFQYKSYQKAFKVHNS